MTKIADSNVIRDSGLGIQEGLYSVYSQFVEYKCDNNENPVSSDALPADHEER